MALDPRITVMPDGSYFYSGSCSTAGLGRNENIPQIKVSGETGTERKGLPVVYFHPMGESKKRYRGYDRVDVVDEFFPYLFASNDHAFIRTKPEAEHSSCTLQSIAAKCLEGKPVKIVILKEKRSVVHNKSSRRGYRIYLFKCRYGRHTSSQLKLGSNWNSTLYAIVPGKNGKVFWNQKLFLRIEQDTDIGTIPTSVARITASTLTAFKSEQMEGYWEQLVRECLLHLVINNESSFMFEKPIQSSQCVPLNYINGNYKLNVSVLSGKRWVGHRYNHP